MTELIGKVGAGVAKVTQARTTGARSAIGTRENSRDLAGIAVAIAAWHRRNVRRNQSSTTEEIRSPLRAAQSHSSTPYPTNAFRQAYSAIGAKSLATSRCTILLWSTLWGLTSLPHFKEAAIGSELPPCRKVSSLRTSTAKS